MWPASELPLTRRDDPPKRGTSACGLLRGRRYVGGMDARLVRCTKRWAAVDVDAGMTAFFDDSGEGDNHTAGA
jgi:hypothetical protein